MPQRLIAGPGLIRRNYFIYTYYILILKPFSDVLDGKNSFKNIYSIKNLFNRLKNTCPLKNQCQTSNLIYRADFENKVKDEKKIYFGLAATTFKERFENHKKISTTSSTAKLLSYRNIYGHQKMRKYHTVLNGR